MHHLLKKVSILFHLIIPRTLVHHLTDQLHAPMAFDMIHIKLIVLMWMNALKAATTVTYQQKFVEILMATSHVIVLLVIEKVT